MALPPLIPVEHFFDNPEMAGAKISPDGTRLSYLAPEEGRMNVWVRDVAGRDGAVCVTHDHVRGIRGHFWSRDSTRILYAQDQGGNENFHLFAADLSRPGDPSVDLTPFDGVRAGIVDVPHHDPAHVLVSLNQRDPQCFDVHRLELATGRLEVVAENPGNIAGWHTDAGGRLLAASAQTPAGDSEILVRDSEGAPFRTLTVYANEDGGNVYGFTPDGSALWVGSAQGRDLTRLVRLDLATAEETDICGHDEVDLGGPILRSRTGELLAAIFVVDRLQVVFFDEEFEAKWHRAAALHHGDVAGVSMDDDERTWVVSFDDDREPGATFLLDATTGASEFLFRPRPKLDPATLAPMTTVRIASGDGHTLHGCLTLPLGVEPRDLPLVLVVHGGPWARDTWGYHPEAQFLANRGYAVLQVNYRGSTGFGKAFMHAAEHEFAGKMHDDLIDAVEWAVAEGIADRDRLAIYGGSYGGYATLVGVTFTPDVFAAAIDYVGPSSLITLVRSFPAYWRPFLQGSWYRFVGDPGTEEEPDEDVVADLWARSPLAKVDRIRTPLLVVQGANDPRVTKVEADQIVAALRARGVEVEYLLKDDEGHGFVNPENRLDLYRAMERFLAEHLGGRADKAASVA
ncbi:MAG TPA: S9 family peptidase [Acidimicrobiales bacterium]|nr:S9 family peptidase [Acidimicrobiales bacterium]